MTKRKSVVSKMLLLVVILTLVSCCFLGSTFARYTSTDSGTGTVNVAKWDISHGESGLTLAFDKLSPAAGEYDIEARTHSTGLKLFATITNNGDVDAKVTLVAEKSTGSDPAPAFLEDAEGNALSFGSGVNEAGAVPTQEEAEEVFSIKLYYSTQAQGAPTAQNTTFYDHTKDTLDTIDVAKTGGVIYVYAEVIWTSDIDDLTGDKADIRDTWLGQNVATVNYVISYTAVQATELPAGSQA